MSFLWVRIKNYLEQLSKIKSKTFEGYEKDLKTKAACERYFEKIAEAVVNLAILTIKEEGLSSPEEDYEVFDILENKEIIDPNLSKKLKKIKGMRNIIAHQYGDVDDKTMYVAINKEIDADVKKFLEIINNLKL